MADAYQKWNLFLPRSPLKHWTFASSIHSWSEKMIKNTWAAVISTATLARHPRLTVCS